MLYLSLVYKREFKAIERNFVVITLQKVSVFLEALGT